MLQLWLLNFYKKASSHRSDTKKTMKHIKHQFSKMRASTLICLMTAFGCLVVIIAGVILIELRLHNTIQTGGSWRSFIGEMAIYLIVGIGGIYFLNTWLLYIFLVHPLQGIQKEALQIVQNDSALGNQIPEPFGYELKGLTVALNLMSSSLFEHTNQLEQKVIERTIVLEEGSRLVQQVLDTTPNMLCLMNCEIDAFNYVNREMVDFFGKTNEELINAGPKYFADAIHKADLPLYQDHQLRILKAVGEEVIETEFRIKNHAGDWRWINFRSIVFQRNRENQAKLVLYVGKDITEHKNIEEQLRYVSIHDQLTGLYNRHYFEEEMVRLEKGRQFPISIIMADMDDLKLVNDRFGHAAGDQLLIKLAALLRDSFRAEDVVARIGGDEFAALLPGADEDAANNIADRIRKKLAQQNQSDNDPIIRISIGSGTALKGGSLNETLKIADAKMYAEKIARKDQLSLASGLYR